jgi:MFS family permease
MTSVALVLLVCAVRTEIRAAEPIVPPRIIRQRTTMLAVLGSLAAGTAMYGASVFLTQYFQISRDRTAAAAGLLTVPMMAGILVASIVGGTLISRTGRLRPFLIAGTVSLTAGFGVLSTINDRTPLLLIGVAMVLVGAGVGMTVQNFVLVVQNSVPLSDIGASSATVSFFRSMGGTIGVTVLGAVLARQVSGSMAGGAAVQAAYGTATGQIFAISAAVALGGVLAAVLLRPVTLRSSHQLAEPATVAAADGAPPSASTTPPQSQAAGRAG